MFRIKGICITTCTTSKEAHWASSVEVQYAKMEMCLQRQYWCAFARVWRRKKSAWVSKIGNTAHLWHVLGSYIGKRCRKEVKNMYRQVKPKSESANWISFPPLSHTLANSCLLPDVNASVVCLSTSDLNLCLRCWAVTSQTPTSQIDGNQALSRSSNAVRNAVTHDPSWCNQNHPQKVVSIVKWLVCDY
jgi:hypothetical protein